MNLSQAAMNVFRSKSFWTLYYNREDPDRDSADIVEECRGFEGVFRVDYDTVEVDEVETFEQAAVVFPFDCGPRYQMLIRYMPDELGVMINLDLLERRTERRWQMGWWDLERWHPFCLRIEELEALLIHWEANDPLWSGTPLPFLLLVPFVGPVDDAAFDFLADRVASAGQSLGLQLRADFADPKPATIEDNFRWGVDPELGWVFTSPEYACYSLRNREHLGSEEGSYPFERWREALTDLKIA